MNMAIASVKTHDKKSIYIKYERGYSLRMLIEKIYIPNFVTRSLQIDSEEKGRLGVRRTAIPARLLTGRTCTGSEFGTSWPSGYCSRYDPGLVTCLMTNGPSYLELSLCKPDSSWMWHRTKSPILNDRSLTLRSWYRRIPCRYRAD
jgi:hypothetical protein